MARAKKKTAKKTAKKKARRRSRATVTQVEEEVTEETVEQPPAPEPSPTDGEFDLAGSPERGRERIHALADAFGREWGTHTAMPLSVAPVANIMRLPFGILMLDWRTGGGLVIGRVNRLKGKKSTLKSTLCLRALTSAQKTCRHCKCRLVINPDTGTRNCRCPETRYWLHDENDYSWLTQEQAIAICYGHLPEGVVIKQVRGVGREHVITCEPPPHLKSKTVKGKKVKTKPKQVVLIPTYRCEPMRSAFVDTEGTIDRAWAIKNGVDPALVLLVGGKWAEQGLESVEKTMLSREFDFVVIDSTSMMERRDTLEEKRIGDRKKVGGKAQIMGDFMMRVVSAQAEEGLAARYRPTLLTTSQLTTKNIGSYGSHPYLGATDGNVFEHGLALDVLMKEEEYTFDAAKERAVYGKFSFKVEKNKGPQEGAVKIGGEIKFWLVDTADHPVGDSDDLKTVMDYARKLGEGFISETPSRLTIHSDYVTGGAVVFSRVGDCASFLRENDTVYDDLRHRVMTALMEKRVTLQVAEEETT